MPDVVTLDTIARCHERLARLLGPDSEPLEVLRRTEEHRSYWRPRRVKVVLLAESHVYTPLRELKRSVSLPVAGPAGLPKGFVRLVYCLGYGENELLDVPIDEPRNTGTPQFWKIFHSCVHPVRSNAEFAGLQSSVPTATRVGNKLALLERLRDLGVWLVDTSLAALYRPNQPKTPYNILAKCLQTSWDYHVAEVIKTAAPVHLVCIGKGVASALGDRLKNLGSRVSVIAQPNARLSTATHLQSFESYRRIVRDANGLS